MAYLKGEDRRQYILFPPCLDEFIGEDAPVRLFDAFVDQINSNPPYERKVISI